LEKAGGACHQSQGIWRSPSKETGGYLEMQLIRDGEYYCVHYYPVENFVKDLSNFGFQLDLLAKKGLEVISVIPNTGLVKASILIGTDFQGVKGFAVISKKLHVSDPDDSEKLEEPKNLKDIMIPTL
jgi:hypothetical protein